jgi:predicted transcriptional regulator
MTSDDTDTHESDDQVDRVESPDEVADVSDVRRPAVEELDQRIVDLLSWILDTETRAKIYVYLLADPASTSEEVARGTGLYPSTVREALAELHDEERVSREKRASEGAGNNPYEYTAIQPSELVGGVVDQVQRELNTIFTLDRVLDRRSADQPALDDAIEPITITVNERPDDEHGSDDEVEAEPTQEDESGDRSDES